MRILAPFSRQSEVIPLIEAGANELYCGVVGKQWQKRYTFVSSINLRHDRAANLESFKELATAAEKAHAMDAKVFLAMNAHFYSQQQLKAVLRQAESAVNAGTDALIVADAALIPELKEEFSVDISLSTANPVFNNAALDFFRRLGASRVVFPRHLSVEEIGRLAAHAKRAGLSTECFVLNVTCPYIDGLCTFQHIVDESVSFLPAGRLACRLPFKATALTSADPEKRLAAEVHAMLWGDSLSRDCGLCALQSFAMFGIDSVKIAGRAHSLEKKLADVHAIKRALQALASKKKSSAFKEFCRELYFELFHAKCDYLHCYYAGVGLE